MVSFIGAGIGTGILSGLGAGMLHERNLEESLDTSYKEINMKEQAQEQLNSALQQDQARKAIEVKNSNLNSDPAVKAYNTSTVGSEISQMVQGQQGQAQQPVAGVPQGLQNNAPIQPQTPTLPTQIKPNAQPQAAAPQTGTNAGGQTQPAQSGAEALPAVQGTMPQPQATAPTPPPVGDIHPASPAATVLGQTALDTTKQSIQDGSPDAAYQVAATALGHTFKDGPNPNAWNQSAYDMAMANHVKFPNLTPEQIAAHTKDYLDGAYDSKAQFNNFLQKQDELAVKNLTKQPITEDKLGYNEQNRFAVLKNNGDLPDAPVQVAPLTPAEHNIKSKNSMVAQRAEAGSTAALDSLLRVTDLQGKYASGVGAGTIADFTSTISSMLGTGQTEKAAAVQQMGKESIDQMVSLMQSMPPGTRNGAQMAKYDLQGVPDTIKGSAPNLNVINSMFGKALMNNQTAYLQKTAGRYETQEQIDQLTSHYAENNPPFLQDGKTPNPKWMSAKDWVAAGGPQSNVTQSGNFTAGRDNITAKRTAAESGANPSEVTGKAPVVSSTEDYNKIPTGQTYTDPQGNIRTKK